MADICTSHMKRILQEYKGFEGVSTLVDVAGGFGQGLNMILSKYPSMKGINFELPQVIENAPALPSNSSIFINWLHLVNLNYIRNTFCKFLKNSWSAKIFMFHLGIQHVGGSMFESIPQGDAIILKVSMVN